MKDVRFSASALVLAVTALSHGCVATAPPRSEAGLNSTAISRRPATTLAVTPSWLLMHDDPVATSCQGDTIRIGGPLSLPGSEFQFQGYDATDPLTIQLCSGGRLVYLRGKGEITNTNAGERIVLPLPVRGNSGSE